MKVIKPHERFWKKVFDYIIEHDLSPFDVLFDIVVVPSVTLKPPKILSKEIKKYMKKFKSASFEEAVVEFILRTFDAYSYTKKLPKVALPVLGLLYDAIMKDYRKAPDVTFEEVVESLEKEKGENVLSGEMRKLSKFTIDAVLHNRDADKLRKLHKISLKVEKEALAEIPVQQGMIETVIDLISQGKYISPLIESAKAKLPEDNEEIAKQLKGRVEGDFALIPKDVLKHIGAAVLATMQFEAVLKEYEEAVKKCADEKEQLRQSFRNELIFLLDEIKAQTHQEVVVKKVKVGEDPAKYIARIEELEAEVKRLREEKEALEELLYEAKEQIERAEIEEEIKPLEKRTVIAYFGLPNPALEQFLDAYNVEVRTYSPFIPPQKVPNLPIVFNIDAASHKVWWELKDKKPLLVSGSNAERIGKRVILWLARRQE